MMRQSIKNVKHRNILHNEKILRIKRKRISSSKGKGNDRNILLRKVLVADYLNGY